MNRFTGFALAAGLLFGGAAQAALIDFESVPAGNQSSYSEQGVTIVSTSATGFFTSENTPNATRGLLEQSSPRALLRADIAGGASSVSVDLGDFNADPDLLILSIYDAANVQLDSVTLAITAADSVMHTLSLSAPNIAYAIFGSQSPSVNGSSVFIDNFRWTAAATVPETGTLALMTLALGLLAATRSRSQGR